jgi:hypothetical protein
MTYIYGRKVIFLSGDVILENHPLAQAGNHLLLKSIQIIFLILGILCCAGIFASLARGKVHK